MDLAGARRGSIRWLFLLALVSSVIASDVDVAKTLIWGPGLNSKITLPVRYFFIQAVNTEGENITSSVGDKAFDVRVTNAQGDPLRIWVQVLDAQDGLYITRLRPYASYSDLVIEVRHQGQHVARSPYSLKGPVYHEQCYCPVASVDKWLQVTGCPASYDQIEADLSPFSQLDMVPIAREMVQRFNEGQRHCLCHYKIIGNKLYRKTYGEHVGFKMFVDDILLSITRKVVLPDMEFFVNLGDWPLEKREVRDKPLPVFSWCGSHDTRDIVMPTYDLTGSVLEMMGRVSLDLFSVQANTGPAWENKTSLAFWRGRDSRQERLDLVMLSRKHPDLVDAALTHMFFFPKDEKKYGDIVKSISFFDFFKHKYQLNIDGTVAAYRLPYLLAGNSVVLKQESPYYEHFYPRLQPYVHFVPLRRDLSDLLTQLQWVKDNDDKAREIARNGQQFTRDHLTPTEIFCYHVKLLNEYSKRIRSKVTVNEDFELVDQPSQGAGCDCKRSTVRQGNHDEL